MKVIVPILAISLFGRIGAALLSQQAPVPPLSVPTVPDIRSTTRTNAAGDLVIVTVIPKAKHQVFHYYGVFNGPDAQVAYIGEMTEETYQYWANQGLTVASGGPQIQRWLVVFKSTNRIDSTLVHWKQCP